MSNTDRDNRENAWIERQERIRCQCGYPDMPGQCPGPAFCPMCEPDPETTQR